MSVPAWPIPIHQTKLMIAKPQPIGILMPHTPTPLMMSHVAPAIRFCSTANEINRPNTHPSVIFRLRTMPPTLSETDARLWPSSITGPTSIFEGNSTGCAILAILLRFLYFRIGVADLRQIRGTGARIQLAQQRIVQTVPLPFRDAALWIVQISEHDGLRGTGGGACRDNFAVIHLAVLLLRRDFCVVNALDAVGAFL